MLTLVKMAITVICFILIGISYWAFSDPFFWWKIPKLSRGILEMFIYIIAVAYIAAFVLIMWLN